MIFLPLLRTSHHYYPFRHPQNPLLIDHYLSMWKNNNPSAKLFHAVFLTYYINVNVNRYSTTQFPFGVCLEAVRPSSWDMICNTGECVNAYCCLHFGEILISCRFLHVVCLFRFRFRWTDWAGQSIFYRTKRVCQVRFRNQVWLFTGLRPKALGVRGTPNDVDPS